MFRRPCLAAQPPGRKKAGDYIGKTALEAQRARIDAGDYPFPLKMAGLTFGGRPVVDHITDFRLVSAAGTEAFGYITSARWSPEPETNIALAFVPSDRTARGTELVVHVPGALAQQPGRQQVAPVVDVPFRQSAHPSGSATTLPGKFTLSRRDAKTASICRVKPLNRAESPLFALSRAAHRRLLRQFNRMNRS